MRQNIFTLEYILKFLEENLFLLPTKMAGQTVMNTQVKREIEIEKVRLNKKMLKPLDEKMHCRICKEFFTYSVITKCSHNFCSVCIRSRITTDPDCPVCYEDVDESDLRKNILLDKIVRIYRKLRIVIPPDVSSASNILIASSGSVESSTPRNTSSSSQEEQPNYPALTIKEERISDDETHTNISKRNDCSNETTNVEEMDTVHPPDSFILNETETIPAQPTLSDKIQKITSTNLQQSLASLSKSSTFGSDLGIISKRTSTLADSPFKLPDQASSKDDTGARISTFGNNLKISSDRDSTSSNFQFKPPNQISNKDGMDTSTSSNLISQPVSSRGSNFNSNNYPTSSNCIRNPVSSLKRDSTGDLKSSKQAVISEVAQNAITLTRLTPNPEWHEYFEIPWNEMPSDLIHNLKQGIRLNASPRRTVVKMIYNEVKKFDPRPHREILRSIAKKAVETYPISLCDYNNELPSMDNYNALFCQLSNRFRCPILFEDEHLWPT